MKEKVIIMQSFGHKCSFCHNLNYSSNQKKLFDKVLNLTNLNEDMEEKSSFAVIWSQMLISSQSKLSIKSKKFFDKYFKAHQPI